MIRGLVWSAVLSEVYRLILCVLEFAVPDPREVDRLVEMLDGEEKEARRAAQHTGNPGVVTDSPRSRTRCVTMPDSALECSAATKRKGGSWLQPPSCSRYR